MKEKPRWEEKETLSGFIQKRKIAKFQDPKWRNWLKKLEICVYMALFYFFPSFKSFSFSIKVVNLCCSGEKSWTRKRYLLFLWNIKSPNFKSQWENRQRRSPCRIHSGDAHAVSSCYDKGVGYICYFHFWDGRLAMPLFRWIVMKSSRLLFIC